MQDNKWENLMFYVTCMYIVIACLIFCLFVGDPKEVDLEIKDDHVRAEATINQSDLADPYEQRQNSTEND